MLLLARSDTCSNRMFLAAAIYLEVNYDDVMYLWWLWHEKIGLSSAVTAVNGLLLLAALLNRVLLLLLTVLTAWSIDYLLHPRLSGGQHS